MDTRFSAVVLLALVAAACGGEKKNGDNTTVADTGLRRDTSGMTAPAPLPADSLADTTHKPSYDSASTHSSTTTPKKHRSQTQSGMVDALGHSTLGPAVRKARPDQDKPVTAKGDTLSASPVPGVSDSAHTQYPTEMPVRRDAVPVMTQDTARYDSTRNRLSDTLNPYRPAQQFQRTDTLPLPLDTAHVKPAKDTLTPAIDSLHPVPADTTLHPVPVDTTMHPVQADTTKPRN